MYDMWPQEETHMRLLSPMKIDEPHVASVRDTLARLSTSPQSKVNECHVASARDTHETPKSHED